jgi:hypothetical protein
MGKKPDDDTLKQLDAIGYGGASKVSKRPLLACDVDEVVLHLVDPFETVMGERGFELRAHAFQLTGNIFEKESGREATQSEIWEGLSQLFEEQDTRQGIVDGVAEGLAAIHEIADIVMLTNMPHAFRTHRARHLEANGIAYPVVTNSGSKVPALRLLSDAHHGASGFIDDSPLNLNQVREGLPDVHLFHFMANKTFREMAGPVEGTALHSGDWLETAPVIQRVLLAER